jgi:hypothetical protein
LPGTKVAGPGADPAAQAEALHAHQREIGNYLAGEPAEA